MKWFDSCDGKNKFSIEILCKFNCHTLLNRSYWNNIRVSRTEKMYRLMSKLVKKLLPSFHQSPNTSEIHYIRIICRRHSYAHT